VSGAIDRFLAAARVEGIQPEVRRFPEGTKTAAEAARAIGCAVGQIVKSLVFIADDRPVMAFTSGANRVDEAKLAAVVGAGTTRRASPEEARTATGFAVGGTPPFGHPERLICVVDRDLLVWDRIWAAAGTPDSVFPLSPADLIRVTGATSAMFTVDGPGTGSAQEARPGTIKGHVPLAPEER
jgi:prolyl-tRNA editing enzyme YbaK/EbsC (Cys-tRNA(Pro) deacylase)